MIWVSIAGRPRYTKQWKIIALDNEIPANANPLIPEDYSVVILSSRKFRDRICDAMIKINIVIFRLI